MAGECGCARAMCSRRWRAGLRADHAASMGRFFFVEGSTDEDGHLHDISVDDLKATDSFDTVEQFWHYYDHIVRANELPPNIDCCLFVDGIKPDIDHEANRGGGKWCGCVATFSRVCPC